MNNATTMTSRERVYRALNFDHPDRVPRDLWFTPICYLEHGADVLDKIRGRYPVDFTSASFMPPAFEALREGERTAVGRYRDEWGCVFESIQAGVAGEVKEPILNDYARLDDLRVPVEAFDIDIAAVNAECASTDSFVFSGCVAQLFERLQFIRGTENIFIDLMEQPPEFEQLLDIVHDYNCRWLESWARTDVDALRMNDDWGSQQNLLISPQQWRTVFKPRYREYARIAHDAGKKLFMHSDGHIQSIYEDIIDVGVDAVNSQLFCMDIEELGRRCAGRITFYGEIDRQRILPRGTREDCRQAVKRVVDNLYREEGGVIAQLEFGAAARLENAFAIYEAWEEFADGIPSAG